MDHSVLHSLKIQMACLSKKMIPKIMNKSFEIIKRVSNIFLYSGSKNIIFFITKLFILKD